jgi:phosphoglycerate dehydrogenase-like enzyme
MESPLLGSDNVTYTPHLAGNTVEANIRAGKQCFDNVFRFLDGEKPFYLVNDVWPSEK